MDRSAAAKPRKRSREREGEGGLVERVSGPCAARKSVARARAEVLCVAAAIRTRGRVPASGEKGRDSARAQSRRRGTRSRGGRKKKAARVQAQQPSSAVAASQRIGARSMQHAARDARALASGKHSHHLLRKVIDLFGATWSARPFASASSTPIGLFRAARSCTARRPCRRSSRLRDLCHRLLCSSGSSGFGSPLRRRRFFLRLGLAASVGGLAFLQRRVRRLACSIRLPSWPETCCWVSHLFCFVSAKGQRLLSSISGRLFGLLLGSHAQLPPRAALRVREASSSHCAASFPSDQRHRPEALPRQAKMHPSFATTRFASLAA